MPDIIQISSIVRVLLGNLDREEWEQAFTMLSPDVRATQLFLPSSEQSERERWDNGMIAGKVRSIDELYNSPDIIALYSPRLLYMSPNVSISCPLEQ